jgi:hypothetical protein
MGVAVEFVLDVTPIVDPDAALGALSALMVRGWPINAKALAKAVRRHFVGANLRRDIFILREEELTTSVSAGGERTVKRQ